MILVPTRWGGAATVRALTKVCARVGLVAVGIAATTPSPPPSKSPMNATAPFSLMDGGDI